LSETPWFDLSFRFIIAISYLPLVGVVTDHQNASRLVIRPNRRQRNWNRELKIVSGKYLTVFRRAYSLPLIKLPLFEIRKYCFDICLKDPRTSHSFVVKG
jgi:hypothetical protein